MSSACLCIKLRGVKNSVENQFGGGKEHNGRKKRKREKRKKRKRKEGKREKKEKEKERKGRRREIEEDQLLSLNFSGIRRTKK